MRLPLAIAAVLTSVLAFTVAPAQASGADAASAELTRVVAEHGLPGAVAVVRDGGTVVRQSAGYADVEARTAFVPGTHVRAASITKTFVAATVLQLVGEGRVALDTPIEDYLPGRIRGDGIDAGAITVRQLLRHQSGLPEYFDADTPVPTSPATADQLLDQALAKPAQFAPGTQMKYTNTNYVVAGLLIEAVTGASPSTEITRRIIAPLGLTGTYFPAPGDTGLAAPFARGYELAGDRREDVTAFNASAADMSGSLISTGEDSTAFIDALLGGRIISKPELEQMMQTVPMPDGAGFMHYGLGLTKVDLPCGVTAWAHGGDVEGYHSIMAKPVNGPAYSVTLTQSPGADSIAEDPRADLLEALYCP